MLFCNLKMKICHNLSQCIERTATISWFPISSLINNEFGWFTSGFYFCVFRVDAIKSTLTIPRVWDSKIHMYVVAVQSSHNK